MTVTRNNLFERLLPALAAIVLPACATQIINSSSARTPSAQATISADSKVCIVQRKSKS
jgi:hypothetical protein